MAIAVAKARREAGIVKPTKAKNIKPNKGGKKKKNVASKRKCVDEPTSNVDEGSGSATKKRKVEKVEKLLTKIERVSMLKTQKVLNDMVFDLEILNKIGLRDLVDSMMI